MVNMLKCPKCPGTMRTYERNGVNLEQCDTCRGIFLDFGELEALTRLETQGAYQPPQQPGYPQQQYPPQPAWGGHRRNKRGFGGLFYSS